MKNHTVISHVEVAQSTEQMDWSTVELRVFSTDDAPASGRFALPDGELHTLEVEADGEDFILRDDPLQGEVDWQIRHAELRE